MVSRSEKGAFARASRRADVDRGVALIGRRSAVSLSNPFDFGLSRELLKRWTRTDGFGGEYVSTGVAIGE